MLIQDIDWLNASIVGVGVKGLEQKHSNVAILAEVPIPHVHLALAVGVSTGNIRATLTHQLEGCSLKWRGNTTKAGEYEAENHVLGSSAWPLPTISRIGPA